VKLFINQILFGCAFAVLAICFIGCGGSDSATSKEKQDEPVPADAAGTSDIDKK